MFHLKVNIRVYFKEPLKMHKKAIKRMDLTLHLTVHLKIAFGSRIEDATEGWSEGTLKVYFDIYTKM